MAADKACRNCRIVVEGNICPICNNADFLTRTWEGHIEIINPDDSEVAKAIGAKVKGKYALKIK